MDYNKIIDLFHRDDVTDPEWAEAKLWIEDAKAKAWADYLERSESFDDAYYSDAFREIGSAVELKGFKSTWVLVKDGEIVSAEIVSGKYGDVWCVKDGWGYDANLVEWVNVSVAATIEKQNAFYAKKGYQMALASFKMRYGKHGFYLDRSTGKIEEGNN